MANDITNVVTMDGKRLLANSINNYVLKFTGFKVGTDCWVGEQLTALADGTGGFAGGATMKTTALDGETGINTSSTEDGVITIVATYQNTGYTGESVTIKELGIYAALFESKSSTDPVGDEVLFSYLSYGTYGSNVVSQKVQSIRRQYNIPISFGKQGVSQLSIVPYGYVSADDTTTVSGQGHGGKLLYLDSDGKVPADITGDANTLGGHSSTYFAISGHTHSNATTSSNGFMSYTDKSNLTTLNSRVNQGVKSTDSPTFAGLTVNGYIDGAKFR